MINFLTSLLSPIFTPMGVSEADLLSYLTQLKGYVWAILLIICAVIVIMFAAHAAKKGNRHVIRWAAGLGGLAALVGIVNAICFGPMYNNVSGFLNASKVELSEETVAQSKATVQKVGEEGMVLVKNDGLLPLGEDVKKLNVFGWASTNPLYGGTGSGSSDSSTAVSILQSLKDAGFETNDGLSGMYREYRADRPTIAMASQDWTIPEPPAVVYNDNLINATKEFSDVAVIVIGRSGGEGADLPTDMNAVIKGTYNPAATVSAAPANFNYMAATYTNNGNYDDFEEGQSYLELSRTERDMIDKVCSEFDRVIVIINANNTMELGWVDEYEQIGAVILAPGAGISGFAALGEIISGAVNPSGRTVDTFVKDLMTTPYINNIGNMAYTNVDDLKQAIAANDGAYEGNIAFANYVEGIYVGYKYYETASDEGAINYEDVVQYPFGYGLSYTTFEQKIDNITVDDKTVTIDVTVTNTGDVAGKDVVEVYFTPPYTNGGIEKASVNLIDFAKTGEIAPGAAENYSFTLNLEDMAAYDSEGIKVEGGGYILEAGDYTISLRSDSHTVLAEETFTVDADVDYSKDGRESDNTPAVNQFDYARGDFEVLSRKDGFANYADTCGRVLEGADFEMDDETRAKIEEYAVGFYDSTKYNDDADEMPAMEAKNGLKLADLTGKDYDDPMWDQLLDQMSFDDMATLINVGGWQTVAIPSVGKVGTSDCDGPAGLSNFITGAYGSAYPAEVLMAQTWSKEMAYEIGTSMGQEYQDANNYGWYGPAMNTHRSAFAGRNFEYYSEDGVLAGHIAAAEINGASTKGVYPYIKHYAVNDQETNRCSFLLTYATEQTLREIYLKPFELAVKGYAAGKPLAVMSAFNWIGSEPACANDELLNTVLRDEWGFRGMVETDYNGSYGYQITDHCIRNGNDLMLGFNGAASNVLSDQSATAVKAMRQACKNILYTVGNSGYYTVNEQTSGGLTNMQKIFYTVDGCVAGVVILLLLIVLLRWRKKNKAAK